MQSIFIMSSERSGSNLVRKVLGSHSAGAPQDPAGANNSIRDTNSLRPEVGTSP